MKIKSIAETINFGAWFETEATSAADVLGPYQLEDGDIVAPITGHRNKQVFVTNFMPTGPVSNLAKSASLRTQMNMVGMRLVKPEFWDGGSRVQAVVEWAGQNNELRKLATKQDIDVNSAKDNREERVTENSPALVEYIQLIVRATLQDVLSNPQGKIAKDSVSFLKAELERWKTVMRARGYATNQEQILMQTIYLDCVEIYNFAGTVEEDRVYVHGNRDKRESVRSANVDVKTEQKAAVAPKYAEATYYTIEEWRERFIAYNATTLHTRLLGAKATGTIATVHPNKKAELNDELKRYFGAPIAAYHRKMPSDNSYVFALYDENGEFKGYRATDQERVYEQFRKIANPRVTLLNGKQGIYIGCENRKTYVFEDATGARYEYDYDQYANVVKNNEKAHRDGWIARATTEMQKDPAHKDTSEKDRKDLAELMYGWMTTAVVKNYPEDIKNIMAQDWATRMKTDWAKFACPTSRSVRGSINDLVDKFFIKYTPKAYKAALPDNDGDLKKLAEAVKEDVVDIYLPIWARVVNVIEEDKREQIISEGIRGILQNANLEEANELEELEELGKIEAKGSKRLKRAVERLAWMRATINFCETDFKTRQEQTFIERGEPVPDNLPKVPASIENYDTLKEQNKYNAWVRNSGFENAEALDKAVRAAFTQEDVMALVPEHMRPEAVVSHFHERFLREMTRVVSLFSDNIPFKSLKDAGNYLPFQVIKDGYESYMTRFVNNFTLSDTLPYVVRQDEMSDRPTVTYKTAEKLRVKVGENAYIGALTPGSRVDAETRKRFGAARETEANPMFKGLGDNAIRLYELLSQPASDGNNEDQMEIKDILTQYVKGHKGRIIEQYAKRISVEEAKRILELLSQSQGMEV